MKSSIKGIARDEFPPIISTFLSFFIRLIYVKFGLLESYRILIRALLIKIRALEIRINRYRFRNLTSAPFLSGDAIADLVEYCPLGKNGEKTQPDLELLKQAQSIFLPAHLLEEFLAQYEEVIVAPVVVTGNSDQNFFKIPSFPSSTLVWIGQNIAISGSDASLLEIHTLPIGLENLALGRSGNTKYFDVKDACVLNKVFVPPMAPSNPVRQYVLGTISNSSGSFEVYSKYLHQKAYFRLVSKYRFVLCLEGNGFENHRIWETLYRNCFPVMFRTAWSETLRKLNLPIFYIDHLDDCTIEALSAFEMRNANFLAINHQELWTPYWADLIKSGENLERS